MKITQLKDSVRNIKKELVSYLSVVMIAMLAVTAFLGINFGSDGLKANADRFYQRMNFRDLEITSTMLLSEDDIESLKEQDGVADAEGVFVTAGKTALKDGYKKLNIVSLTKRINTPEVLSGRLPQSPKECALEQEVMSDLSLSIGDEIALENSKGERPQYLLDDTFTVTGCVHHPDHYALETQAPGERYVLVTPEAFDSEALDNCFMKAVVKIEKPEGISYYNNKYTDLVKNVENSLEEWKTQHEKERTEAYTGRLDEAGEELADGADKLKEARNTLDENAAKLEDGKKELADGKVQLDNGKKELEDGEKEVKDGEKKLADGKEKLDEAYKELDKGHDELSAGREKLDAARAELDGARQKLDGASDELYDAAVTLVDSYNAVETKKAELRNLIRARVEQYAGDTSGLINWADAAFIDDPSDPDITIMTFRITDEVMIDASNGLESGVRSVVKNICAKLGISGVSDELITEVMNSDQLAGVRAEIQNNTAGLKDWEDGHDKYVKGLKEYNDGLEQYNAGLAEYNKGLAAYEDARAQYENGLSEYNKGKEEYEEGAAKLEEARKKLKEGRETLKEKTAEYEDALVKIEDAEKQLVEGEEEYSKKRSEYEDALAKYNDAVEQKEKLKTCHFVIVPGRGNASFTHAQDSADNVSKIGRTFALLFVVLGALVIYATVGRIINEQRRLVGTQKALGFFSNEVFRKHLIFGVSATIIGIMLGALVGYLVVQKLVLISHQQFYVTGVIPRIFDVKMWLIVFIAGVALAALSVYWACGALLKESARALMQDAVPKGRKKTQKKERKGSLYSKLIIRNMLTDWKRVLITIISIAGCCILLVIGFSLQNSIQNAINFQFSEILTYSDQIEMDSDTTDEDKEKIYNRIQEEGMSPIKVSSVYRSFSSPEGLTAAELLCFDSKEIKPYFHLRTASDREDMELPGHGIIITRRISEVYGLDIGDSFTVYDTEMNPHEAEVTGIFDYYFGKIMMISRDAYKELFESDPPDNTFWVKTDKSEEEIREMLQPYKGFESVKSTENTEKRYNEQISVLTMITAMLILSAALMAYFVLLNLVNMYLNKKKKELTIMRINGFTTKEVTKYVAEESFVTTILGIILGLVIGAGLGYLIIRFVEQAQLGLMRKPDPAALLISAGLTALFSIVINAVALRKIKYLKLRDIA